MTLIPWRVKNFLSNRLPLLYHLVVNAGFSGNSRAHWDLMLARNWDKAELTWPTKNELIASLTKPSDMILDIGCGNGSTLRHLRSLGYRWLHGLEISKYAIRRLRGEGFEMHYGALPSIPLPEASFDVVIASQVLEHVIRRRRFLCEVRRVLRVGGQALIFVPDDCLGPISAPEHVIKYNVRSLRKFAQQHLSVVKLNSMRDANHSMPVLFAQRENAVS